MTPAERLKKIKNCIVSLRSFVDREMGTVNDYDRSALPDLEYLVEREEKLTKDLDELYKLERDMRHKWTEKCVENKNLEARVEKLRGALEIAECTCYGPPKCYRCEALEEK